jgi:nucleotide-binding universal stress UspA family protein
MSGTRTGTIVVGVDGSACSKEALRWALGEARLRGANVRAVRAWQFPPLLTAGPYVPPVDFDVASQLRDAARESVEAAVREVAGETPVETEVVEGPAARVLLREAEDAELLVVGSRGHGGFAGLLLGSTSHQCAQHARCPVVVVRDAAA